jgi:hypothetical protein
MCEIEDWPRTWARHIRQVKCDPPGPLTAESKAIVEMKGGFTARMVMAEFRPRQNWKWSGKGRVGPTNVWDHQLRALDERRTQLDFVLETDGFLEPVFGRMFASYLRRQFDRNLPLLAAHLEKLAAKG